MTRRLLVAALLLAGLALIPGCSRSGLPTVRCSLGGARLRLEVARDAEHQARGLMYRKKLGRNRGMLFVYDHEAVRTFWMKNTFIPLSVAFIDRDKQIVHLLNMRPRSQDSHSSIHPCMYVIEVNRGWFEEHGVEVGDTVQFKLPEG